MGPCDGAPFGARPGAASDRFTAIIDPMTRTAAAAVLLSAVVFAQTNPSWLRPFPAHKIAGNVYYVGTEDLACYLLTSPDGHILINTGLADSTPLIRESISKLGFRLEDVKILLTMQAHFDHVAAMGDI